MSAPSNPDPSLFIRLYLDRHITPKLVTDLRARGYDILTTSEAGKDTAEDAEQLDFATRQGRSILTFNIRDFAILHQEAIAAGNVHAGIVVSRQIGNRHYGLLLGRVIRLLETLSADDMRGNFVHLERFKQADLP